jgi:hypothetical protein
MVNIKLTKAMPGRRLSFCGNRFQTKDVWNEHTVQCVRELRAKLRFKCAECYYAAKRERDLNRHAKTRHRADSREKTYRGEIDNKGKVPGIITSSMDWAAHLGTRRRLKRRKKS